MPVKLHTLPAMTPAKFSVVMDADIVGDGYHPVPMPKHLVFEAKTWFYILSKSLISILDVHDDYPIPAFVQHAIVKLVNGIPFDFEDCFIRTLVSCVDDPATLKPYAPLLMAVCNYSRDLPFPATIHPSIYTPPVRDVLQIAARPNDPFAEHVGIHAHVTE